MHSRGCVVYGVWCLVYIICISQDWQVCWIHTYSTALKNKAGSVVALQVSLMCVSVKMDSLLHPIHTCTKLTWSTITHSVVDSNPTWGGLVIFGKNCLWIWTGCVISCWSTLEPLSLDIHITHNTNFDNFTCNYSACLHTHNIKFSITVIIYIYSYTFM